MDDPFRPPPPPVTVQPPRPHFLLWSIPISGAIHLFIALFFLVLMFRNVRGCAVFPSGTAQDGQNGRSGSGGTEVEVSLENPPAERMGGGHPAAEAAPPPPPAPTPEATPQQPPRTEPSTSHTQRTPTLRAHAPTPEPEPAEAPPPAPAIPRGDPSANAHANNNPAQHPASSPSQFAPGAPGGGTAEFLRNSGLRPGSIGSQRALLPRAVHCNDEVAGIWRAQKYDPLYGDWMLATLHIHRGENNALHGTIVVHQWDGGPFAISPPVCGPDGFDFLVDEPGQGFARDRYLDFGADSWRLRDMRCNATMRPLSYRPDHFTGLVDSGREEFQSVNNDGGRAVNDPMVFRRIGCVDEGPPANDVSGASNPADGGSSRAPGS